jgi:hypothetical protein
VRIVWGLVELWLVFVGIGIVLKSLSVCQAVQFLLQNGARYAEFLRANPLTGSEVPVELGWAFRKRREKRDRLYSDDFLKFAKESRADYLLAGRKDYLLRNFYLTNRHKTFVEIARFVHCCFFRGSHLIGQAALLGSFYFSTQQPGFLPSWARTLGAFVLAFGPVVLLIALSLEAMASYVVLGSYAHGFEDQLIIRESDYTRQLINLSERLVGCALSTTSLVFIAQSVNTSTSWFNKLPNPSEPIYSSSASFVEYCDLLLGSAYFSIVTFFTVGYGDVHPTGNVGRSASMFIQLLGFATLVVLAGAFWAQVKYPFQDSGGTDKNGSAANAGTTNPEDAQAPVVSSDPRTVRPPLLDTQQVITTATTDSLT